MKRAFSLLYLATYFIVVPLGRVLKRLGHILIGKEGTLVLGFIFAGAIIGGVSVLVFPQHFISSFHFRLVNLIVTPFISGALINISSNIKYYQSMFKFHLVNFVAG